MALRDELRKEVAHIKSQQRMESEQREADEAFYRESLLPVMREAHAYFSEVVDSLQIISPDVSPRYPLNPTAEKDTALRQCEYRYRVDDGKNPREVDVLCQAVLDRPVEFFLSTRERAEKHAALLDAYDFAYHRKNFLDKQFNVKGATFYLEGPMRVYFRMTASGEDRCVYIDRRNLGEQRSKRYKFGPEELHEEFFDRLTNLLLRKEKYLIAPNVGEVERDQLRRQLEQERQERENDLAEAFELQEARREAEREALLRNRTKKALAEGSRSLLKKTKEGLSQAKVLLKNSQSDSAEFSDSLENPGDKKKR